MYQSVSTISGFGFCSFLSVAVKKLKIGRKKLRYYFVLGSDIMTWVV